MYILAMSLSQAKMGNNHTESWRISIKLYLNLFTVIKVIQAEVIVGHFAAILDRGVQD